jgi:hypothetical protein
MSRLKRISMAGSDVAVTDGRVADLVLEYAKHLGRVGTTDAITLQIARHGRAETAALLLGPASQIAITENDDESLDQVVLPRTEEQVEDIRRRNDLLLGRNGQTVLEEELGQHSSFTDFDTYS